MYVRTTTAPGNNHRFTLLPLCVLYAFSFPSPPLPPVVDKYLVARLCSSPFPRFSNSTTRSSPHGSCKFRCRLDFLKNSRCQSFFPSVLAYDRLLFDLKPPCPKQTPPACKTPLPPRQLSRKDRHPLQIPRVAPAVVPRLPPQSADGPPPLRKMLIRLHRLRRHPRNLANLPLMPPLRKVRNGFANRQSSGTGVTTSALRTIPHY